MKKLALVLFMSILAATSAAGQDFIGTLNDAPYKIRVPENWNGELLVYAHGIYYLERWNPATQFDFSYADAAPGGQVMEDFLLGNGYALAGTTFRGTGFQVKEGTNELVSLVGLFKDLVGRPMRTILIGYSMGSLIALKSAEEVPIYDGIIAGCTIGSGTTKIQDLAGAGALAYATLFGWPAEWGTWYDVRDDINFNAEVLPVLMNQLSDPNNIPKFEFLRVLLDSSLEGYYQNPGWLIFHMFGATEARGELEARAKGPVVQNVDHLYALSDADKGYLTAIGFTSEQIESLLNAMNAATVVKTAPPQRHYLAEYFDPSGDFRRPVISIHEIGDGFIGVYHESVLRDTVMAAKKQEMFVQAITGGTWHCGFTGQQLLSAIDAMDYWLDAGVKPGSEFFPKERGFIHDYVLPAWPIGTK
jgi:pimeloyl-ACP methyl ester carboxylesterase